MVDFVKSLKTGLDAAKVAEDNREEIDAVFYELNRQLSEATKDKVQIKRGEFSEGLTFTKDFRRIRYWALAVYSNFEGVAPTEIAKWSMERSGYPCSIEMGPSRWHCEDRAGLENALGFLLQDPVVGETIQRYIRMAPPSGSGPA